MPLDVGTQLGPYEILKPIGAGGMGEVYQARDSRLDRTVAIKVLPEHVASDPDLKQRFEREAKTVAALSHPHICPVFDIGSQEGVDFLVMEHLEGETLAERLQAGALPLRDGLRIAAEIADALDGAHRQGIVHRDLKPGNIMLTPGGAKLLDFGLAKLRPTEADGGLTALPTRDVPLTQQGTILGTFQYMAPEQLEGREADARSDIFALGAVTYEIVSGRRAFTGESQASLIGAIMHAQPEPLSAAGALAPPALDHVVATCLEKDPEARWQTAGDVRRQLAWIQTTSGSSPSVVAAPAAPRADRRGWPGWLPWAVTAVAVTLAAVGFWVGRPGSEAAVTHLSIGAQPAMHVGGDGPAASGRTAMVLSDDGRTLYFAASDSDQGQTRLYRRDLSEPQATVFDGTEGAEMPFLSPDEAWLGYWADGALMKLPTAGGPRVAIVPEAVRLGGAVWGTDGRIVYSAPEDGLFEVSADGGTGEPLTTVDPAAGEAQHLLPRLLPGGDDVLFTVQKALFQWDDSQAEVVSRSTGERRVVVENAADARYVGTGHLVFVRMGTLMAAPFDPERLETTGGAVALVDGITQAANVPNSSIDTGAAQFDVSASGDLVYLPGGIVPDQLTTVVWVDREGNEAPLFAEPAVYYSVRLSPDGDQVAYTGVGANGGVWVHDLRRGATTRLSEEQSGSVAWTPDGRQLIFDQTASRTPNLFSRPADGSGPVEQVTTSDEFQGAAGWTPDGRALLFAHGSEIWMRDATAEPREAPVVQIPGFRAVHPALSPDGQWLAYTANDSGRQEVYLQPYPGPGARRQVSAQGGDSPTWSPSGGELFYLARPAFDDAPRMTVVDIVTEPTLEAGRPRELFDWPYGTGIPIRPWDIDRQGQRFLVSVRPPPEPEPRGHVRLIGNWTEELRARVPTN